MSIVVISFDGVKDTEFEAMANDYKTYPNIAKFKEQSQYRNSVKTIFVSNTYPVHATISTGKLPKEHGVVSNYVNTERGRRWTQMSSYIKAQTIWDAAAKNGFTTASIFWPITCGAKNINWNMPEVHTHGRENQIAESLRHGSRKFQLSALLRHGAKLRGFNPIFLDNFISSVACDLIKKSNPDLTLIHLFAYDLISHRVGSRDEELNRARKSLDNSLGKIMGSAKDSDILVFSDHGHFDVSETIDLYGLFGSNLYEQCGGSAFFKQQPKDIEKHLWFGRFLSEQEMDESGYADSAQCAIAAKRGYCFAEKRQYRANHGYPADYEDYNVFYALLSNNMSLPNPKHGDVRDITAIITEALGIKNFTNG